MSETPERLPGQPPPWQVTPIPPIHPPVFPPPVTFDFSVPSITVNNPRSLETDTDFATIAIATLAPDGTEIAKYGPTSKYLGNLGKGQTIDPGMSLTGIEVPDGGSVAFTFVVVNRGAWIGDDQALEDMSLVGASVLGALVQGQIVGAASIAGSIGFWPAVAVAAAVAAAIAGLDILLADCDGVVVSGAMTIGKTELLSGAATQAWETPVDYPGTDSPVGCGANSDYTVRYAVGPTPPPVPMVAMPAVIGLLPKVAAEHLSAAGLQGVEETVIGDLDPGLVSAQSPAAGVSVPIGSTVKYTVRELGPGGHPD
jgi:PASTA domain